MSAANDCTACDELIASDHYKVPGSIFKYFENDTTLQLKQNLMSVQQI